MPAWTLFCPARRRVAATVEQFIQCFADASGRDMTQFMRWYSQAGTPEVTVAALSIRHAQYFHPWNARRLFANTGAAIESTDGDSACGRACWKRWARSQR